ncbi:surface carbohydrate biosynthesis protein [Virgibacillus flavescens]|uniref:surface carbohydrate biosynthesis protein n=1 Tax=Virgibacillus flavescens TaxID=1611422 RepID=UPI003D32D06D
MKNNKRWLYLPVEVKVRELDAKLLVAYYAIEEGYQVILGEHRMVESASAVYPNGIFFSKGYPNKFRKRIITNAKKNGHVIVELDEEGLIMNNTSGYLSDRMKFEMLDLVNQEYCWGKFQHKIITSSNPQYEEKCSIVGNPRFDLLKSKFQSLYDQDAEKLRNEYGAFILINTRFSIYNSTHSKHKEDPQFLYFKQLYDSFVEMINAACKKFPDTNFVIRPHPGENADSYRTAFSSFNNVHVIHEGSIIKWILASSVIIQNGCTSSIEAFLLGKPIISFLPVTSNEHDLALPNKLGVEVTKIEEVNATLENLLSENNYVSSDYKTQIAEGEKCLHYYCKWSDQVYSYETILRLLNKIQIPMDSGKFIPPQKTFYLKENKKVKHYFPSLSIEEIQVFFNKLDVIEGKHSQIIITKLGRNLYKFHKK